LATLAGGELTTRDRLRRRMLSLRRLREQAIEGFIFLNALLGVVVLVGIMGLLLREGLPLFRDYSFVDFVTGKHWFPVSDPPTFGMLPSFTATLWVTGAAIAIALPIGVLSAVFLSEMAPPWLRDVLKPLIELISGVPSIVIGFIGLLVLAPFLADALNLNTGLTGLTAAIMLAFMSLPLIISISDDALRAVPDEYREGAYALGATRWQTVWFVLIPAAFSGVTASVMLGIGRAVGETMTVLMVAGGALKIQTSITEPMRPMTATIAAEINNAVQGGEQYRALFATGIVLFILTFIANLVADIVLERQKKKFQR